jgi:hypothetical protein
MLKDKWSLITGMALKAQVIEPLFGLKHTFSTVLCTVRLVTAIACHFSFFQGMVRHIVHLCLLRFMAGCTEIYLLFNQKVFSWIIVDFVTACAGYITQSML